MKITLPLPHELTSVFVVALDRSPLDAEAVVPWRISRPYRRAALDTLGTPLLKISSHDSPWRPTDLLSGNERRPSPWGPIDLLLSDDERRLLRTARGHVLISSTAPHHAQPAAAQTARAAARAIVAECGGLIIDPLAGLTVFSCEACAGERARFRLDDDWLGWGVETHDDPTCPPCDPSEAHACTCLSVTSRGLRRFGLPEITLEGASCTHNLCAVNLLRLVARQLLSDHLAFVTANPTATERVIDDHLRIDHPLLEGDNPFLKGIDPSEALGAGPTGSGPHTAAPGATGPRAGATQAAGATRATRATGATQATQAAGATRAARRRAARSRTRLAARRRRRPIAPRPPDRRASREHR